MLISKDLAHASEEAGCFAVWAALSVVSVHLTVDAFPWALLLISLTPLRFYIHNRPPLNFYTRALQTVCLFITKRNETRLLFMSIEKGNNDILSMVLPKNNNKSNDNPTVSLLQSRV